MKLEHIIKNSWGTHFWKRPQLSRRLLFRHAASAVR
mgnify:FL=1